MVGNAPHPMNPMAGMGMPSGMSPDSMNDDSIKKMMGQMGQNANGSQGQGAGAGAAGAASSPLSQPNLPTSEPKTDPRDVGSFKDELLTRPAEDVLGELKKFFSLNTWLGIDFNKMSEEDKMKAQQFHSKYTQLDSQQQQVAQQMYQERMQRKKAQEQEDHQRKQIEAQQKAQNIQMPSSPQKGAQNPQGSKKQKATMNLQTKMKQPLSQIGGE